MHASAPPPAFYLTPQERRAVAVIQDFVDSGIGPSLDQIAGALGVSKSNVHRLASQLERKGWVRRLPYQARSITLIHRLAPAPGQAMAQLLTALLNAKPSEGFVNITLPLDLITSAAVAFGVRREV